MTRSDHLLSKIETDIDINHLLSMDNVHEKGYYQKFKIKTSLKASKHYQEDIAGFEDELKKLNEVKYEIKDKYGRVMDI